MKRKIKMLEGSTLLRPNSAKNKMKAASEEVLGNVCKINARLS